MPIPALDDEGFLPEGVYDCSLEEVRERFGQFQTTDHRCRLFDRLADFVRSVKSTGLIVAIIVDGSFVTSKDSPNDIDLILVVRVNHDFSALLRPFEDNVLSRRMVRRLFGFDVIVAGEGTTEVDEGILYFAQIRNRVDRYKGLLRIGL